MKIMYQNKEVTGGSGAPVLLELTLPVSGWGADGTQTVAAPGVLADETAQLIQVIPADISKAAYDAAGVECTGQGADTLTFRRAAAPSVDMTVYVTVMEVQKK